MPLTISLLALADGVHLVAIAALCYLLGGHASYVKAGVFLAGLMATHFAGGLVLLVGWGWVAWSPPGWWAAVEWAVVATLVVLVVVRIRRGLSWSTFRPPRTLTIPAVFLAGVGVSLADLAVDLPYHIAAARIVDAAPTLAGQLGWLVYYHALYAMPMVAAALAYVVAARRVTALSSAS